LARPPSPRWRGNYSLVPGGGREESPPVSAKLAGIPNSSTVRDIEYGRDSQLSNVEAVAKVLGLRLELAELSA